jgi:hypothetical protein
VVILLGGGPMQARIFGAPEIRGNFFVHGLHWRRLVEACYEHHERMVEREERRQKAAAKAYVRRVPTTTPIRIVSPPDAISGAWAPNAIARVPVVRYIRHH